MNIEACDAESLRKLVSYEYTPAVLLTSEDYEEEGDD